MHTFDSAGVSIRYVRRGEGEPVVLVHGFALDAEINWIEPGTFDALCSSYDVVALDMRGHGRSGKPLDPGAYGFCMAEDVARLLDHLGLEKAHVVGYSMGAEVALQLLVASPGRFRTAVLGGAGWRPPEPLVAAMGGIYEALSGERGFAPLLQAIQGEGAPPMAQAAIDEWESRLAGINDQKALAAVLAGSEGDRPVTKEELRANRVPTLAVIGENDLMLESLQEMAGVMSSLEVEILPGQDHVSALTDPRLVATVLDFLARN